MDYKEIFDANRQKIKNIIKLVTKEDNEDLEQEVYLKALRARDKYKDKGKFLNWISTIAYNVSRDYLKSAKKRYETGFEDESEIHLIKDKGAIPDERLIQKERQAKIISAINSLNKKHRETLVLSEIYNMTYEEVAKKAGCPVGTVKSRIYNAKKELFNILKDFVIEE